MKTIQLTATQLQLAQKLGISVTDYAKHLAENPNWPMPEDEDEDEGPYPAESSSAHTKVNDKVVSVSLALQRKMRKAREELEASKREERAPNVKLLSRYLDTSLDSVEREITKDEQP